MAKENLGVIKLDEQTIEYVLALRNELEHYQEGAKWLKSQIGIPENVIEQIDNLVQEIEINLKSEEANIKNQVLQKYTDAINYDLRDGVVYVWRE